ncbi:hypothetical protein [Nocardiopsis sp. NPDC006938]|uniref:hypothetical protein n=1 Tax=Nocardiopsis sp. NPDC006938 TaxID=3364337 RepID=UPI0036CD3C44
MSDLFLALGKCRGHISLQWQVANPGAWDSVALYDREPAQAGADGYLANQWQWATRGYPADYGHGAWATTGKLYETGYTYDGRQYWAAYITYDYGRGAYRVTHQYGPASRELDFAHARWTEVH